MSFYRNPLLFLLAFVPTLLAAQTGTIRGFVYDQQTGEPVIFTNVILKGTTIGAATDVNGYYSISKVTPGSYTLQVTYLGYDTAQKAITVGRDQIITEKLYLKKSAVQIREFEVRGEKQEAQTQVRMGVPLTWPRCVRR